MNTREANRANYPDVAAVVDCLKAALAKQKGGVVSGVKVKRLLPADAEFDLANEVGYLNCNRCIQYWWYKDYCKLHGMVQAANLPPCGGRNFKPMAKVLAERGDDRDTGNR